MVIVYRHKHEGDACIEPMRALVIVDSQLAASARPSVAIALELDGTASSCTTSISSSGLPNIRDNYPTYCFLWTQRKHVRARRICTTQCNTCHTQHN